MAEMWRYDGGGVPRRIREVWRYGMDGVPRKAREIWRYGADGVARKVFSGSFVLTASTASVYGSSFTSTRGATVPVTTSPVTLTVQGGGGGLHLRLGDIVGVGRDRDVTQLADDTVPAQCRCPDDRGSGQYAEWGAAVHGDGNQYGRGEDDRRDGGHGALV